jgi:hypothetical protein
MSVVVKNLESLEIEVFIKGADNVVIDRIK